MTSETHAPASGGARTIALWSFFVVAAAGFAATLGGALGAGVMASQWGSATAALGAVGFLGVLLAQHAAATRAPPKQVGFDLSQPAPTPDPVVLPTVGRKPGEELVEFSLSPGPRADAIDDEAWPASTQEMWNRQRGTPIPRRAPDDAAEFYVPPAFRKRQEFTQDLPLVKRVFDREGPRLAPRRPDGKTRGKCSDCGTYLWAPKQRPIRLKCPSCGKIALLTA